MSNALDRLKEVSRTTGQLMAQDIRRKLKEQNIEPNNTRFHDSGIVHTVFQKSSSFKPIKGYNIYRIQYEIDKLIVVWNPESKEVLERFKTHE